MSYFPFLGHPMNLKRCLCFLGVCIVTFFLALVPPSFFRVDPVTAEPLFTLTQQRVIAIFVFTAFGLFVNGLEEFDRAYENGEIDKVFTTNLV